MKNFAQLGVHEDLIKRLDEMGIVEPTPVQEQAIPFLIEEGADFICQAQTGTGKTAAFGLPMLQKIKPEKTHVQTLILAPTRELGKQIAKQLFKFTKHYHRIFIEAVYGGDPIDIQVKALSRPTHIVVATPGRLLDLLKLGAIDLSKISTVILDEADEMISLGFRKDLEAIFDQVRGRRRTWLFSATMQKNLRELIKEYLANNAKFVQLDKKNVVNKLIDHRFVVCRSDDKVYAISKFIQSQGEARGVVFCRMRSDVVNFAKKLEDEGCAIGAIQGDLSQHEREKIMRGFRNGRIQILVATDVAARGIDIEGLAYVAHQSLPDQVEYYTHRSGRTGRAGNSGVSVVFITSKEMSGIRKLEARLGITFNQLA
ncbi:DEAD/DEAH box helicase [Puniceicoccaceae bacterium K14]|nr:DEAD/DEAH box helicase [Puniceicoccaceae bacterium K14]